MPGAFTPSSLLTRIRYGGGCRLCCADAGASKTAATKSARRTRVRCMKEGALRRGWLEWRNLVEDEAVLDLFHRQPLGLEDTRPVGIPAILFVQTQTRSAPQLLGAH